MIAGLPYDAEVEYLQSTGNGGIFGQVINSDVLIPGDCTHVEYHAKFAFTASQKAVLCGHQTQTYGNPRTYLFYTSGAGGSTRQFYAGNPVGSVTVNLNEEFEGRVILDSESNTIVVYRGTDIVILASTSGGFLNRDFPIHFFGGCHGTALDDLASMKIWYFRIVHGNGIVRDFIPVRFTNEQNQSEGAMYDRVSRKLFRNAGTGAFTIGPDVATPVMGLHFFKSPAIAS